MATAQKGVLTRAELRAAGISRHQVSDRVKKGLLISQHRGVYRVGHAAESLEATYLAAVKACGTQAYLYDRAAAYLQELLRTRNPPPPQVMCATERSVPGVKTRRARRIHPLDVAEHRGIPVTTVPRTLLDLAARCGDDELLRACHEAWVKWKVGPEQVQRVLDRHPRARGARRLRRVISSETRVTLGRLESGFLTVLRDERIELPETNRKVGSKYVDCRWPGRLTVELDSYAFHNSRKSWEEHHERRREAIGRGEAFRTYTWHDITEGRNEMATEVRSLLASP